MTLAILAYAAFALSFVLSILYLIQSRQIRRGRTGLLFSRLPPLEVLGRMNRTSVSIGLAVLALSVVLGLVWAERFWTTLADPKVEWAVLTLLVYGLLLWMDRRGWEGPRVALLSILGLLRRPVLVHRRQHVPDAGAQVPMSAAETRLLLLGWNFRGAEASVRERIAFTADEVREALERIRRDGLVERGRHRRDLSSQRDLRALRRRATRRRRSPASSRAGGASTRPRSSSASFYREGPDAARHLFRVAAGLESMALGESEVLGQVRSALRLAREAGATRAVSHRMFESAVAAGKRVRSETEISRHPLSVASIGYELASRVFGEMSERTILVLGAGETGTLFAKLAGEAGVADVRIANRTPERAEELARSPRRPRRALGALWRRPWPRPTSSSARPRAPRRSCAGPTSRRRCGGAADGR